MSSLVVEVCTVSRVEPHPNADKLDICVVKGWQVVTRKGEFKDGDTCVYFPPDTVLSKEWTDRFGVTSYCQEREQGMRIRQTRLRGEPSFGLVVPNLEGFILGSSVVAYYGAVKYEPPVLGMAGDILGPNHPMFPCYTDIEDLNNFPDILRPDEFVCITEKIHGTNCRVGLVEGTWMAGSHRYPRKMPETEKEQAANWYWHPYTLEPVRQLIQAVYDGFNAKSVVLFGETYGKIQSLNYGHPKDITFAAFDLWVDGRYMNAGSFFMLVDRFGIPAVPRLFFEGHGFARFSHDLVREVVSGESFLGGNIREGVVIRPMVERTNEKVGRAILKAISPDYRLSKHADKDKKDV